MTTGDAGGIGVFPTAPPLTPCQQAAFWAVWDASGLPHVITGGGGNNMANGQGNVIAENNPNMDTKLGGNNRGIDHAGVTADTIFNTLFAAYGAAYAANCP